MDKNLRTMLVKHRMAERMLHAELVREIELLVEPHLHKTGYVGDDGPLLAVFFPERPKKDCSHARSRKVRNAPTVDSILGFVKGGVADDVYVGLSTRGYETMFVDDLVALLPLARKLATKIRADEFSGRASA